MNRKKRYYKDSELLRKGKNCVYVYPGYGYRLQKIETHRSEMTIEELAYICVKSNKGRFFFEHEIRGFEELQEELENDERYYHCDLSQYGLDNGFLMIKNLKTQNVEIHI